jgi:hypothetical protein
MEQNVDRVQDKTQYVYEGKVWVLTGRKAVRTVGRNTQELIEIVPIDIEQPSPVFCKWVKMIELFEIVDGVQQ